MNKYFYFLLSFLLAACSTDTTKTTSSKVIADQKKKAFDQLHIQFASPTLIDSSVYVMYPLPISEVVTEESGSYGSSYSREVTYWNIVFLNTKTGEMNLLDENRKMVIQSFTGNDSDDSHASTKNEKSYPFPTDKLLYYLITTRDLNNDGELTAGDPTYLFTSDKKGRDFQQISPDSMHVTNWEIDKHTAKILLQTIKDSNHNHQFGEDDEVIPYIYDISTKIPQAEYSAVNTLRSSNSDSELIGQRTRLNKASF